MNIQCPKCKTSYSVEDSARGQNVECTCGAEFAAEPVPVATPESTKRCRFCAEIINVNAVKCKHCGEFLAETPVIPDNAPVAGAPVAPAAVQDGQSKKSNVIGMVGKCLLAFAVFALICAAISAFREYKANPLGNDMGAVVLLVVFAGAGAFWLASLFTPEPAPIICPNPNCGYRGPGVAVGGSSGCLLVILLCLGVLPGILYFLFVGKPGAKCPRCGMRAR